MVTPETASRRDWLKIGAMCAALIALVVRAFREAIESRPQS